MRETAFALGVAIGAAQADPRECEDLGPKCRQTAQAPGTDHWLNK